MQSTPLWHHLGAQEVMHEVESSEQGLSAQEARARLERDGPNRMSEPPKRSPFIRFMLQFHNILIYVLLGAAVMTALLDHISDTFVILAVVLANAIIGYIQEGKAEKALDAIKQMLAPHAAVMRGGMRQSIDGEALVVGDIVLLEAGDKVPADLRLLKTHGFAVQEALLTGESLPVDKKTAPVSAHATLGDRLCMAFSGTTVTAGTAQGVVIATGAHTEIGRISGMLQNVQTLKTPLVEQMDAFAKWLTIFILGLSGVIFVYGLLALSMPFDGLFMAIVGLAVAAIPEGLPAVLTITLAVGVEVMAKRNAIVRRLPAIETIGAVSVICTDKTGTLTRNEMMVAAVALEGATLHVKGEGYAPLGDILEGAQEVSSKAYRALDLMAKVCVLCNDAELRNDGGWSVEGDPMEGALLAFAGKAGCDFAACRGEYQRTDAIPFDAKHQYMATLHHNHKTQAEAFIYLKGAPEKVLALCHYTFDVHGKRVALEGAKWEERAAAIAAQGQRVLAIAYKTAAPEQTVLHQDELKEGLILLGLVGLIDPPRTEAISAVKECHDAGIAVKMITGDHALTAATIGKEIGLKRTDHVLTGVQIDKLSEEELVDAVMQTDIFARTTPEHKLRLVMALQSHGLTVAMTGDGVNDSPALKRADAGIAMGQKGSEAAKEASELVLADDNFASIVAAVREGRTVYTNIRRVISWTLPTNAGEALVIILALLLAMPLPITPIQILWVNMITAVTLGIALAFEPTDAQTMRRKPRNRSEAILSPMLIYQVFFAGSLFVGGVFGLYRYALAQGVTLEVARTMAMNALVFMEIVYLFHIRSMFERSMSVARLKATKAVWIAVGVVVLAQALITYTSFMQGLFDTKALSVAQLLLIVATGAVLFVIIEAEKQIRLRYRRL
ncbi:MAG: HAD-IC family P-type ATPase [Campylobacterales bacterium]|nr:HAD-IC family P-type ATPase [Campylobacterales bacterium]